MAIMYLILCMANALPTLIGHQTVASVGWIRSTLALKVAGMGALGFLGALGFVPGWERLFGFMGFFGLIGVAYIIEVIIRSKNRTG
jgi:hypothetical protein